MKRAEPEKQDTVKISYLPTGIRVGMDLLSIIKTRTDETFRGYEVNADLDFHKYYLAADYGTSGTNYYSDTRQYEMSGSYFRLGADINILKKDPDKNVIFFGLRYAQSIFSESMTTTVNDTIWGTTGLMTYANPNAKAHWLELTGGLKVKIWKGFWMGYTARYKFGLSISNTTEMVSKDVPGYGVNNGSTWGFNYQLFWRIPLRKVKSVPPKK